MSESRPNEDNSEFDPATSEQIERMTQLVGQLLDGTAAIASRRLGFHSAYLEGEFLHHWIAKYSDDTGEARPVENEEAANFPKPFTHNPFGNVFKNNALVIDVNLGFGEDYDSASVEASVPLEEDRITYLLNRESLGEEGEEPTFRRDGHGTGSSANQGQGESLRALVNLIIPEDTLEPIEASAETAQQVARQFDTFEIEGMQDDQAEVRTSDIHDIRLRVLRVLTRKDIDLTFMRSFGTVSDGVVAMITFGFDKDGRYAKQYEVRTGVPAPISASGESTEGSESDVFVTKLRWSDDGEPEYSAFFDVDFNKVIEQRERDPDFNFARQFGNLINETKARRDASIAQFAEEQAEGFHIFSQADAHRLITTLENPGEESTE